MRETKWKILNSGNWTSKVKNGKNFSIRIFHFLCDKIMKIIKKNFRPDFLPFEIFWNVLEYGILKTQMPQNLSGVEIWSTFSYWFFKNDGKKSENYLFSGVISLSKFKKFKIRIKQTYFYTKNTKKTLQGLLRPYNHELKSDMFPKTASGYL